MLEEEVGKDTLKSRGKHMAVPKKKIKYRITLGPSNSTSGYIHKRTESTDLNRYLYTHVLSGIIHNSQKVERTEV